MPKTKSQPTKPRRTWRNHDDAVLLRGRRFQLPGSAESLHPDVSIGVAAVAGDTNARDIIDSYSFRFTVTLVAEVLP